jgi:protein-disulfide isomerase
MSRTVLLAAAAAVLLGLSAAAYFVFGGASSPAAKPDQTADAAPAAGGQCTPSTKFEIGARDVVMGSNDAPLTLIEYASLTCPHCAHLHEAILPAIQQTYIDKGLVRYVFRDFPLNQPALAASVLTRCVNKESYYPFLAMLFGQQRVWAGAADAAAMRASLQELSARAGLSQADFEACLQNKAEAQAILQDMKSGESLYCIVGTPTVVLNGRVVPGEALRDFEGLDAEIRKELKSLGKPVPEPAAGAGAAATPPAAPPGDPAAPVNPAPNPADGPSDDGAQPPSP